MEFIIPKLILLCLIKFGYSLNQRTPYITDEELEEVGLLTHLEIRELGIKTKPNLYNQSYFEGDIVSRDRRNEDNLNKYISKSSGRHWPNNRVPYVIDYEYNPRERLLLGVAIKFFEKNTCIRWVKKELNDHSWVSISGSDKGCFSRGIGRSSHGKNQINLDATCFQLESILHEMMHRIGFIHEQARPDRDYYVEIIEQNIIKGSENQFETRPDLFSYEYGLPYDIHSIMHYFETAFSVNGEPTIVARNGQKLSCDHSGLKCPTDLDITKINIVYNCSQFSNETFD